MLSKLIVNNFALIKDLKVEFCDKLNVISGETGSGKSLVMKALKFVLGDRADKSYIRNGEKSTKVQCEFSNINSNVINLLNEIGVEIEDEESIIISRSMNLEGKSDIRINGNLTTLSNLNKVTKILTDFYGQQEHYSLLEQSKQKEIVDSFNENNIVSLKKKLNDFRNEKNDLENKLKQNYGNENDKKFKVELLEYEIKELGEDVFSDEDEDLLKEKKLKFQSMEKIKTSIDNIKSILDYSSSNSSISNAFKSISFELRNIEKYEKSATALMDECDNLRYEVEDFDAKIEDLSNNLYNDDIDINEIESRLDLLKNLKRKYGNTKNEREAYLKNAQQELDFIVNNDKVVKEINEKLISINKDIMEICKKLYSEREISIKKIETEVVKNLKELDMKNAQFKIAHNFSENIEDLTSYGLDSIEFMFSSNLGQPLKPLMKIISGGELSRFMLAYKNVIMMKDGIDLLIFDEIDSGISGAVGQKVALKINGIAKACQVISISHLPQIVSMADKNLIVSKTSEGQETFSNIKEVTNENLLREIARLSGSKDFKEVDLQFAKEMRENALSQKASNI